MCQSSEWWAGRMSNKPQGRARFCGFRASSWKEGKQLCGLSSCASTPGGGETVQPKLETGNNIKVEKTKIKKSREAQGFCCASEEIAVCKWAWQGMRYSAAPHRQCGQPTQRAGATRQGTCRRAALPTAWWCQGVQDSMQCRQPAMQGAS